MTDLEKSSIIIKQICKQTEPGKKMLQKLMYLIIRKGVDLNLNYSIHFYGPYSAKFDESLHVLESYGKITIDTNGRTHVIRLGEAPIQGKLKDEEQEKVDFVIKQFIDKTAQELEAITTIDYVATKMLKNAGSDEEIIDKVKKIKGEKFSQEYLQEGLQKLKKLEYV